MVTEKDVVEYLNKAAREEGKLKEPTQKYLQKLKELERLQNLQQEELASLRANLKEAEDNLVKTRGAISVVLELAAEEEGLFNSSPTESTPEPDKDDQ